MAGSIYGNMFRVSTWGETHGKGVGVVIDGCPAGLELCEEDIQKFLDRRKPGQSRYTTKRKEADLVEILSGVFEGKTTGTPISLIVMNQDQRSKDYSNLATVYRPGHADYSFDTKYGFRDYRGGGRSSGRETTARVAAGAVAIKILNAMGISLLTYTKSIGPVEIDYDKFDAEAVFKNPIYMPDPDAANLAAEHITAMFKDSNSVGGVVECIVTGMKPGIGEPVFDKLDASLAKGIMSIGAVKGFEIGDGMLAAKSTGSVNNDVFYVKDGRVLKKTNHAGGTLGGISDGSDLIIRAAFKPTASIARDQETVTNEGEDTIINIHGRHDPVIVPRAVVVVESMTAITLLDLMLMGMSSKLSNVVKFYR